MLGGGVVGGGTPRKHKLGGSTGFLARPRLGPLKNVYGGGKYFSRPLNTYGLDKKKKIKKPPAPKLEYRKKPDYADTAYREAVSRLRILLAESYTPIKRPLRELDSAGEETDNQSLISGISRTSRYPHYHQPPGTFLKKYPTYTPRITAPPDLGAKYETSPELMSFIERQEEYIEQLERESRFCKDELSTLLGKVKDVISENECLHEKQKNNLMKSVFDQFETETETEAEIEMGKLRSPKKCRKQRVLEGPAIVFESRISELEAQLTQTKIDLKKAQEENDQLRKKYSDGGPFDIGFENSKKQLDALQRDKSILQETVSKLQAALNLLRDKEHNTSDQVKRSLDVAEQAKYEKSAAEHEIRRLKDELERQHGKLRESINDQSRRVADERSAIERRYSQQIEQLTAELGVHWEQSSKLQLEMDKQRRENSDLRRELAQKQALIDELKKEMQNKIITLQSDIGVSGAEKSALEQQISNLHMSNERTERQGKQEAARLQVEMQSLRQRLDRADADLIHSRRENIRLTEQVAALEKEIKMNAALSDEKSKAVIALPAPVPKDPNEDMGMMIKDMESKHVATVAELEGMIQSQNQLMDKLSSECHALTQKLEESSTRHKEEIRELQTNLDSLTSRFSQSQTKAEEYGHVINKAQHEPTPPPIENPAPILSRTSSKSSINQPAPQQVPQEPKEFQQPSLQEQQEYQEPNLQQQQEYQDSKQQPEYQQYQENAEYPEQQDPNQEYQQEYDPNQQWTQEQYNQQYSEYDPNAQYPQEQPYQEYDPNAQEYPAETVTEEQKVEE